MPPKKTSKKAEESLREEKIIVASDEEDHVETKKKPTPKQKKASNPPSEEKKITKPVEDSEDDEPQTQPQLQVNRAESESENSEANEQVNDKRVYQKDRSNFTSGNDPRDRRSKHAVNSAINFSYNDYRELNAGIKEVSTEDALKVLITRAHDLRQNQLCETLKQTLRAMHFECNFPAVDVRYSRPEHDREREPTSYGGSFYPRNEAHGGTSRGRGRGYGDQSHPSSSRGRGRSYGQQNDEESPGQTTSFRTESMPMRGRGGRGRGSEGHTRTGFA